MPPPQAVADVAQNYADDQAAFTEAAVTVTDRATSRLNGDPVQWQAAVADATPALLALQQASVVQAEPYLTEVLAAQGADTAADAVLNTDSFVDLTDGGGSWTKNLVYAPPSAYADAIASGSGASLARSRARHVALSVVLSGMQDIGRSAALTAMFTRPSAKGYVRALRGKSCARCAILAGRRYRASAFRRHPRCDCYMIPSAEDDFDDWTTDPLTYFRRLSTAEQDAIFTEAGARAIREGADISQVVNASDGVTVVQSYGRSVRATTSGTSVRGVFGGYEVQDDGSLRKRAQSETTRLPSGDRTLRFATTPRLMPDEIFQLAETEGWDRAETLRQLRRFGYVI